MLVSVGTLGTHWTLARLEASSHLGFSQDSACSMFHFKVGPSIIAGIPMLVFLVQLQRGSRWEDPHGPGGSPTSRWKFCHMGYADATRVPHLSQVQDFPQGLGIRESGKQILHD